MAKLMGSFLRLTGIDGNIIKPKIFGNVFLSPCPTPCIGSTIEDLFGREWIVRDLKINHDAQRNGVVFNYTLVLKKLEL